MAGEKLITDRLFLHPDDPCPKSLPILYLLAWRYILTDFYRIHYDNASFSEESVLARTIERFTKLCCALLFANATDSAKTAQAGMGRQPKKRIDLGAVRPLYESDNKDNLIPSAELQSLASRLGVEYMIKTVPEADSRSSQQSA